ncbi:Protein of unknown function DUF111 [Seminavis robusta]|uniref:Uncharacterized protein n=1 Tax=Seminavis robusta TaxID=568900 RepID=A0A9N8D636_9STRA|nr:Protein of unknown function DUF111 [Seminavis robusta]|eukprot:Sro9_g007750.1 Protein of unknown function DUF111 (112) ;mRNA; r:234098-234737
MTLVEGKPGDSWVLSPTNNHAHFDCFSGAAGDMMLAACLDAAGEVIATHTITIIHTVIHQQQHKLQVKNAPPPQFMIMIMTILTLIISRNSNQRILRQWDIPTHTVTNPAP